MTTPDRTDAPLLPELPLGIGAAFLVVAGACTLSESPDRPFLVAACAAAGVLAVGVAAVMARRSPGEQVGPADAGGPSH
jgi:hypothetical protein